MYGAVLRRNTELVDSGKAHVGVLFLTNDGYSTMCGHATLAVARLLVDSAGACSSLLALDTLSSLSPEKNRNEVDIRIHVPCGLVNVTVPIMETGSGRWRTDTSKAISYVSVPSYATGLDITIPIPVHLRWPKLKGQESLVADIAYGGAFYIVCPIGRLGFTEPLESSDLTAMGDATARLKKAFNLSPQLRTRYLEHNDHSALSFLYGTLVTDTSTGVPAEQTQGAETGLCFFSNGQIDRSPTGSGVQAKIALAYAKGEIKLGERWTYHSPVSNAFSDNRSGEGDERRQGRAEGAFIGEAVQEIKLRSRKGVVVKVSGWARYTGACTFVVEKGDNIGKGFYMEQLNVT